MAEAIGEGELVRSFAGCFFGATNGCCSSAVKLVGAGGGLANCLCDPESASFISEQAKSYGMNVDDIMNGCVKKDYEVPFNFNEFCPARRQPAAAPSQQSSPPPPSSEPSPSPALIPDPSPPQKESPSPAPEPAAPPPMPQSSTPAQRKPLPTLDECVSKAEAVGQAAIVSKVIPCLAGGGLECCNAALELVGNGGDLELCLCSEESASFITDETEKLGFDLKGILSKCVDELDVELPFFGNEYCGGGGGGGSEAPALKQEPPPMTREEPSVPAQQEQQQPLPTLDECVSKAEAVGQAAIVSKVIPCLAGGGLECCNAALELVGNGGDLELCLCSEESASFITDETEKLGFDLKGILSKCVDDLDVELPFFGNEYCGGGGGGSEAPALKQEPPPMTREEPSVPAQQEQRRPLPTLDECVSKAEAVGQAAIVSKVIPCLAGGGMECCNAALELVGNGGDLELCLCSEESASFITDETEKLGFDLKGILSKCVDELDVELPFFGNEYCGGGGGSEAPEQEEPQQEEEKTEEKEPEKAAAVEEEPPAAPGSAAVEVIELPPGVTTLPSTVECGKAGSEIGESQIIAALMPCLDQPSEACCAAAENLIGPGGALAFCGCNLELVGAIEALAGDLGLTPQQVQSYVSACPRVPLLPAGNCPAAPERESNLLGPGSSEERQEGPAAVGELAAPGDDLLATPSNPIQPTEDPRSSTGGSGGPGIPTWVWGAVFCCRGRRDRARRPHDLRVRLWAGPGQRGEEQQGQQEGSAAGGHRELAGRRPCRWSHREPRRRQLLRLIRRRGDEQQRLQVVQEPFAA